MVEKIAIWILTKVVSVFSKETLERVKNRHQNSKNASHDHKSPYKKRHGQLHVFCIGMEAQRSLDSVYVVVQFLEKRRATKHRSREEVEQTFRERQWRHFASTSDKRQDGMRVANNEQYLIVLGGPGAGKSTFLRKVGLEALKGEDGTFEYQCIPVFLELRRFTEGPIDIEAWVTEEFKICGHPYPEQWANSKLKSGELLILFDGLDEVPEPKVNNVINKIRDFVHQYSQNRFIASCRVGAYKGELTDFAVVEMADFDDSQIEMYINNWFASASNRKMKTAQRCWQALNDPEHRATKALAQNPLSLALLCTIYEESQDFPSSQAILYEKIFNIFLKKWTAEKGVQRDPSMSPYLAIPTVKDLLSEIAAENFKENRLVFREDELINQIQEFYQRRTDVSSRFDASEILDALLVDPGLFIERSSGIYTFFHLTFQEYLTANSIKGDAQSIQRLVTTHLHNEQWQEVFLLTVGLMREADDLLEAMETEAAKSINTNRLKSLFQWAKRITNSSDNQYSGLAKRAFVIDQYLSLLLFNTNEEEVKNCVKYNLHFYRYLNPDLYQHIYLIRTQDSYQSIYLTGSLDFHGHTYLIRTQDSYQEPYLIRSLDFYQDLYFALYADSYQDLYQDLYRYIEPYFYRLFSAANRDQFDEKLRECLTLVKRMEQMKIFKGIDLQQMVRRFNEQQKFIKAAAKGKSVKPPEESIHDTWLSVLQITDDMLAISHEEIERHQQYIRAVKLILACKEAAGRVSLKVWQEIEDRLLAWDTEESED